MLMASNSKERLTEECEDKEVGREDGRGEKY
jgi:hypothetical protein